MFTRLLALLIAWVIAFPAYGMDVNGELKKALLEKQASDPTGYEARVYYNTTSKKPLVYNGVIWSELGGSSGGSGEKNYISANPSAATDTAGWTCVGDLDIARTTTASELPREITTPSGFKITADANVQSVADYCYFDFTLDDIDVSKKLNIKWSQKQTGTYVASDLAVVVTTQADRTTALHTPQVTNIAAADYDFNAYGFDTSTTLTLSLVIRATADMATNGGIVISDVVVGPGKIITGAAEQYLGSLSGFTVENNGSKGFTVTNRCWRKVNLLTCKFTLDGDATASGSAATTNFSLVLPAGYTIDGTAVPYSTLADHRNNLGYYTELGITTAATYSNQQEILPLSSTSLRFVKGTTSSVVRTTDLNVARDMDLQGEFTVPIAEWAGSGTVNLGANDYEVAYTTGSWDADSTATAYGWTGATISGDFATTFRSKTVTWQTPIQNGEEVVLWMKPTAGPWQPAAFIQSGNNISLQPFNYTTGTGGAESFGFSVVNTSTTTTRVNFGRYGSANMAGAARGWNSDFLNYQWAVVKGKIGSAVGFSLATATESGLVKANRIQKKTASGSWSSNTSSIITFSNLTLGVVYRITYAGVRVYRTASGGIGALTVLHNSVDIVNGTYHPGLGDTGSTTESAEVINGLESSAIFTAAATTVTIDVKAGSGGVIDAYAFLEELNNYSITTAW